jgi:hypothetical protein
MHINRYSKKSVIHTSFKLSSFTRHNHTVLGSIAQAAMSIPAVVIMTIATFSTDNAIRIR